jgi:hypothetical protein
MLHIQCLKARCDECKDNRSKPVLRIEVNCHEVQTVRQVCSTHITKWLKNVLELEIRRQQEDIPF